MNWCGRLNTRMELPRTASCTDGLATTLVGSRLPGRYLTFSWCLLMMSVSFCGPPAPPPWYGDDSGSVTSSSYTHICTSSSNSSGCERVFSATILELVDPQLPDPMTVTLCRGAGAPGGGAPGGGGRGGGGGGGGC